MPEKPTAQGRVTLAPSGPGRVTSLSVRVKTSPVAGLSMSTAQASVPEGPVRGSSRANIASSTGVGWSWARSRHTPSCRLRVLLGYDRALCAEVVSAFTGAVSRSLRRRAKAQPGLSSVEDAQVGAVTFVQRSDSALRLNVHAHSLFLDGVYVRDATGALAFHGLGAPTFEEVEQVARWTHARIEKILLAHGRTFDGVGDEPAELTRDQPVLASCYAASAADVQLLGESAGQRTLELVQPVRAFRQETRALAEYGGVNVHAEVAVDGRDRQRLEHVLRYMARPPLALDRLSLRDDGQIVYRFKKAWRDGTNAVVLSPQDFIAPSRGERAQSERSEPSTPSTCVRARAPTAVSFDEVPRRARGPLVIARGSGAQEAGRAVAAPLAVAAAAGIRGGHPEVREVRRPPTHRRDREEARRRGACARRAQLVPRAAESAASRRGVGPRTAPARLQVSSTS